MNEHICDGRITLLLIRSEANRRWMLVLPWILSALSIQEVAKSPFLQQIMSNRSKWRHGVSPWKTSKRLRVEMMNSLRMVIMLIPLGAKFCSLWCVISFPREQQWLSLMESNLQIICPAVTQVTTRPASSLQSILISLVILRDPEFRDLLWQIPSRTGDRWRKILFHYLLLLIPSHICPKCLILQWWEFF